MVAPTRCDPRHGEATEEMRPRGEEAALAIGLFHAGLVQKHRLVGGHACAWIWLSWWLLGNPAGWLLRRRSIWSSKLELDSCQIIINIT
jgi:hypothetical protein